MSTTTTQVSWFHRTFPGLSLFTKYRRRWLRGDVLAGITVAAYLVPQVMAYATIAGLPPVTGLWTIIPAFVTPTINRAGIHDRTDDGGHDRTAGRW